MRYFIIGFLVLMVGCEIDNDTRSEIEKKTFPRNQTAILTDVNEVQWAIKYTHTRNGWRYILTPVAGQE